MLAELVAVRGAVVGRSRPSGKGRRFASVAVVAAASFALLALVAWPVQAASQRQVDVIVVLDAEADDAREVARDHEVQLSFVYATVLDGFAGSVPEGRIEGLRRDRRVDYVELDKPIRPAATRSLPTGIDRVDADVNDTIGIDGVDDQRVDVDVAIIDTGIDLDHPDLNVVGGVDCLNHDGGPPWNRTYSCVDGGDDGHGHGTHVAGTVAALDDGTNIDGIDVVGVAPGARLFAVKVLDDNGSGSTGSVIAGIDWVTTHGGIEVANMSLGGSGESQAMDDALKSSYQADVAYAVAAGNSSADVDGYHPAGSPWVLTVSALADFDGKTGGEHASTCRDDVDDTFADFSNYGDTPGQDVDVIAPGVCILSTSPGGGYADGYSGTSMASPHVAGAAALLASAGSTAADIVGTVTDEDVDGDGTIETSGDDDWTAGDDPDATKEPLADVGDSEVFAASLVDTDTTTDPNTAPTATFTYSCSDLACDFDGTGSADSDGTIDSYDWDFGDGTTAAGSTVSHTYGAAGDYTVTLTVTDNDDATDTDSQVVSVSDGSAETGTVHIHDLSGNSINNGPTWTAEVTVFVHDDTGPVGDETVTFDYVSEKGTVSGSTGCGTVEDGTCTVTVAGIAKSDPSITFTATGMSSGSLSDSHQTQITVSKP